jgi:hypothetical protein
VVTNVTQCGDGRLFRHYWVLISLVLTFFATVVLLLHMPNVSLMADMVRRAGSARLAGGRGGDLPPAVGGLLDP